MNAQLIQLSPMRVVAIKHVGPYEQLGPKFEQLWNWASSNNVPIQRILGLYWDDPEGTPAAQLRSAACIEVGPDYQLGDTGGLPIFMDVVPGGQYANMRHVGPYEGLPQAWASLTEQTMGRLGKQIADGPAVEIYMNDASVTPADQLITELFMPVA